MDKLNETVESYAVSSPARFHMPGHKGTLSATDITELSFSDDLHNPHGVILQLEEMCANTYNTKHAYLSVNGATCGICAFELAMAQITKVPHILVGRDCHRSFVNGAILSGALVRGVYPGNELGGVVETDSIEFALKNCKGKDKIDAVFVTSPNFYGMCCDLDKIARVTHENGALLFVDAAHGAHFPFSDRLPINAAKFADICVVSTHKTLSALGQSAIVLQNTDAISMGIMRKSVSMLQTTSPSYVIMQSIEKSIRDVGEWDKHIDRITRIRSQLSDFGIKILAKADSAYQSDITRLCILSKGLANNGYELDKKLQEFGIYVEMADSSCVVLITTPCDPDEWYDRLMEALCTFLKAGSYTSIKIGCTESCGKVDVQCDFIHVRGSLSAKSEFVSIKDAIGRRAKEPMGLYPPGISLVFPNEIITKSVIGYMQRCIEIGGVSFGIYDDKICVIKE